MKNSTLRIGIDARLWGPRGVGRYIQNLIKYLQQIDAKNQYVLFVTKDVMSDVNSSLINPNWSAVQADIQWHTLREQILFPRILNRQNLDLMHFPYFSVPFFYRGPYIITLHDIIINKYPTGKASTLPLPLYYTKRIGYNVIMANALKKAKKIIVPTFSVKDDLIKFLKVKDEKVAVTYESSDLVNVKAEVTKRVEKLVENKFILYVGNAYPHKNLNRLIQAFRSFHQEKESNIVLILAGKKDYFYEKILKEINSSDKILFFDSPSDSELVALYKSAKSIIIPSVMEGFGLPAVEAMSLKCPVLSSDIPTLREVCKDSAIYFDPQNVVSIKEAIKKLITSDTMSLSKLKEKGYTRSKEFSWEKMAIQTYSIYSEVLPDK